MNASKTSQVSLLDLIALLGPSAAMFAEELAALDLDDSDLMAFCDGDWVDGDLDVRILAAGRDMEMPVSPTQVFDHHGIDCSAAFPLVSGEPVLDAFLYQSQQDNLALAA